MCFFILIPKSKEVLKLKKIGLNFKNIRFNLENNLLIVIYKIRKTNDFK